MVESIENALVILGSRKERETRLVRKRKPGYIFISDGHKLTQEEVKTVLDLAEALHELADPIELLTELDKEAEDKRHWGLRPSALWRHVAWRLVEEKVNSNKDRLFRFVLY